ncbi:tetratricopeptide repeat protein 1-like [Patiria miniata]|uniref:Tetratricopeptide repeat protein 1 n=1 Tax=Patiria miniata TaxID=46514 RepID=A0A914B5H6_PATMI|nr:tetratricopeptide repeat protein 1-like [Patiria miniata]
MDSTSSLPSEPPQNPDAKRTPSLEESDSDEEFFDAVVVADDDEDDDDNTATSEETEDKAKTRQHQRSEESVSRDVDDLIQSKLLGSTEDRTADDAEEDAKRNSENSSDGSSQESDSEDEQFFRPVEHDKLHVHRNRIMENTGPYGDAANHEGLRAEQEEGEETGAGQDQLDGGATGDEEAVRELEEQMTDEEKQAKREEAQTHKTRGNELFKSGEFADAVHAYSQALQHCPLCYKKDRSIMLANRAACKVRQEDLEGAITDCTKALELNPLYLKVVLRRAQAYELTDKLEDSLKDYQRALELDPGCYEARAACMRLPDQIKERNEKLKEEMMSKLKDLGNLCLRPFGLSTNNFQFNQDPATGSYSVNFNQNPGGNNGK